MGGLGGRNDHQRPADDGVWRDVVAEVPDRGHKDRREVVVCWGVDEGRLRNASMTSLLEAEEEDVLALERMKTIRVTRRCKFIVGVLAMTIDA
jgi:hypothetical protein